MSFIEKNKAWILPLLGVGVLGVLYMNFRPAASPAPATGPEIPQAAGATPAALDPSSAPPPAPEKAAGSTEADLWEDLRAFAAPPPSLADENNFRDQARRSAQGALQSTPPSVALAAPAGVREPKAVPEPSSKEGAALEATPAPPPALDFLISGPTGARAWFEGQAYRSGQTLDGKGLSVGPIGFTSVELKGPKGKTVLTTNPLHHSGPSPRPAVEAP